MATRSGRLGIQIRQARLTQSWSLQNVGGHVGQVSSGTRTPLMAIHQSCIKKEGRKCFMQRHTQHILFTVIWRQTYG